MKWIPFLMVVAGLMCGWRAAQIEMTSSLADMPWVMFLLIMALVLVILGGSWILIMVFMAI